MDLLYTRYANPMELVNSYINRGRFGEFVSSFMDSVNKSQKEEFEKDDELKGWIMYCLIAAQGLTDKSFNDWKNDILGVDSKGEKLTKDADLSDNDIEAIINATFPG